MGIYVILLLMMGASWLVQWRLRSKFDRYSQIGLQNGMSGAEIAELMLADHNIRDVRVISTEGRLTDHYNPTDKTVNLSADVFAGRSAAAAAVAAHEVGHAVQHATAYNWLGFRSKLVPVLNVTSMWTQWILLIGVLTIKVFPPILGIGVLLFALTTLFSFIMLPVEFDASRRALAWIDRRGVVTQQEHGMAKDALWWAAMTYVVAAIGSLATLLYYASIFFGARRD